MRSAYPRGGGFVSVKHSILALHNFIWGGVKNWMEVWFWVPLALCSIIFTAQFCYMLTGRSPSDESADYIMGYAQRLVVCVLVIVMTSVFKEATGVWLTKKEKIDNPMTSLIGDVKIMLSAVIFTYIFLH